MIPRILFLAIAALVMSTGAVGAADDLSYQSGGGLKVTVLYGHPKSADDFEKYYFETHMPMVVAANPGKRMETSKVAPAADGSPAPYYRIFQIWFDSQEEMAAITSTPAWRKVVADVPNFATGVITRVVSRLD